MFGSGKPVRVLIIAATGLFGLLHSERFARKVGPLTHYSP